MEGRPVLFVFSPPWPEARQEARGDGALERKPGVETFKQSLKKETGFNHRPKLGYFFVLLCPLLAPEIYKSFGQNAEEVS